MATDTENTNETFHEQSLEMTVWSDDPNRIRSLRAADGTFLTPGAFTGVHGPRSVSLALASAKFQAMRMRKPYHVFNVYFSLQLPPKTKLLDLLNSGDEALSLPIIDIRRLLKPMQKSIVRDIGKGLDSEGGLMSMIQRAPAVFFQRFFANPAYAAVQVVYWVIASPALGLNTSKPDPVTLATVRPTFLTGATSIFPKRDLVKATDPAERSKEIQALIQVI